MRKIFGTTFVSASLLLSTASFAYAEDTANNIPVSTEETVTSTAPTDDVVEHTTVNEVPTSDNTDDVTALEPSENEETVEAPILMPTAAYEEEAYNAIKGNKTFTHHGLTVTDKDMFSRYVKYHLLDGYNEINVSHYSQLAPTGIDRTKAYKVGRTIYDDPLFKKYSYRTNRLTRDDDLILSLSTTIPQAERKAYYETLAHTIEHYVSLINEHTTAKAQIRFLYDFVREEETVDMVVLDLAIAASNFKGTQLKSDYYSGIYAITLNGHQYVTSLSGSTITKEADLYYLLPLHDYEQAGKYKPLSNVKRDLLPSDPFYKENRIVKVSKFTKTLKKFGKDVTDQKVVYFLLEEDLKLRSGRMYKAQETLKDRLNLQDVKIEKQGIYLKVTYTK